jgi:hypothetical protein
MNKPFPRPRPTAADADGLYIPIAWYEVALSRDFSRLGGAGHHPDNTSTRKSNMRDLSLGAKRPAEVKRLP